MIKVNIHNILYTILYYMEIHEESRNQVKAFEYQKYNSSIANYYIIDP